MKIDGNIPNLLQAGIEHIAYADYEHVYNEIIDEYGEKLKQDFISQMKEKMKDHAEIRIKQSLDTACDNLNVIVEVHVKGVEWK